jgi:hypothetical protein
MKRVLSFFILSAFAANSASAIGISDPLYMPEQTQIVSDTAFNLTNNDLFFGKSSGLYEKITYAITNNISAGAAIGYAHIDKGGTSLTDPVFYFDYRFLDGYKEDYFMDIKAFLSPKTFKSPFNGKDGAGKGFTSAGARGVIGSDKIIDNTTLGAGLSVDFIGGTDYRSSGAAIGADGFIKYYFNDANSFQAALSLKRYSGFGGSFNGIGMDFNYARDIISERLAVLPRFGFEAHSKGIAASVIYGVGARYLF